MKTLLTPLVLCIAALDAAAQYNIDWFAFDGGGGQSSGGAYSLNASMGLSDAGFSGGGPYTMQGGFWSAFGVVQADRGPSLRLSVEWPKIILSWPSPSDGFHLQETPSLLGPTWTDVKDPPATAGLERQVRQEVAPGTRFYRLRKL